MGTGTGFGDGNGFWERVENEASKDIAESPTAQPERPKGSQRDNETTSFFQLGIRS